MYYLSLQRHKTIYKFVNENNQHCINTKFIIKAEKVRLKKKAYKDKMFFSLHKMELK